MQIRYEGTDRLALRDECSPVVYVFLPLFVVFEHSPLRAHALHFRLEKPVIVFSNDPFADGYSNVRFRKAEARQWRWVTYVYTRLAIWSGCPSTFDIRHIRSSHSAVLNFDVNLQRHYFQTQHSGTFALHTYSFL